MDALGEEQDRARELTDTPRRVSDALPVHFGRRKVCKKNIFSKTFKAKSGEL